MEKTLESILSPLLGRTWRGEFASSTPERPVVDIARYEAVLNGQAVRCLHSINDGEYGGETLYLAGAAPGELEYWYFTTAGFHSHGTLRRDGNVLSSRETLSGETGGITEVRGTATVLSGTEFVVRTEHLAQGTWVPGHEARYRAAPGAEPRFRAA
jgi:hypothetical protein